MRVEPKHVLLADKAEVTEDMKQRLAAGEKVIYFANRVSTVLNLYRNALQEYRNEAAVSFSSDDELDKQEKETREILEKRDEIQAYIAENQKLPDDIVVVKSEEVPKDWHPRYQNSVKTYEYHILNAKMPDPTRRYTTYFVSYHLDLEQMRKAAEEFVENY